MPLLPKHVSRNSQPNRFPVKSQIVGLRWFLGAVARSKDVIVGIPHLPQANSKHWLRNQSWHRHSQGNLDSERPASHNRPDTSLLSDSASQADKNVKVQNRRFSWKRRFGGTD